MRERAVVFSHYARNRRDRSPLNNSSIITNRTLKRKKVEKVMDYRSGPILFGMHSQEEDPDDKKMTCCNLLD